MHARLRKKERKQERNKVGVPPPPPITPLGAAWGPQPGLRAEVIISIKGITGIYFN